MGNETLVSLTGSFDNLDEPMPFSNHPSTILGVNISLQIFSWICGLLRLWTRYRVVNALGWDDLFVALSLVSTLLGTIMVSLGALHYGLGKHFLEIGGEQAMADYLVGFYISYGCYNLATTFIKLALLLQYLRIFDRGTFPHRFSIIMAIIVGLWGFAFNIVAWFPCSPINDYWSLKEDAKCYGFASQDPQEFQVSFIVHSATNVVLDLIVLSIPFALYFDRKTEKKTKWGLVGLLFLGVLANFASIWRLATIIIHKAATWPTFDPSWYGCSSILLACVEVDMGMICACVPVFWPVLQASGFQIFITKEVEVTSESRTRYSGDTESGIELKDAGTLPAGLRRNRHDSDETLRKSSSGRSGDDSPLGFHDDKKHLADDALPWERQAEPWDGQPEDSTHPGTQVSVSANGRENKNLAGPEF